MPKLNSKQQFQDPLSSFLSTSVIDNQNYEITVYTNEQYLPQNSKMLRHLWQDKLNN